MMGKPEVVQSLVSARSPLHSSNGIKSVFFSLTGASPAYNNGSCPSDSLERMPLRQLSSLERNQRMVECPAQTMGEATDAFKC
jgi:hypothetical protein